MRDVLILTALLSLAACGSPAAPPVVFADSGWRTAAGYPLSLGEVEALRQSCVARQVSRAPDRLPPPPNPVRDNPAYRPGGEGLANAPATGIAAADALAEPVVGAPRFVRAPGSVEDCLYGQGLVQRP